MANDTDALKKAFIKEVQAAARSRFVVDVFADMVRAMALSIEGATTLDGKRLDEIEAEYAQIKERYDADDFAHFPQAFAIVFEALEARRIPDWATKGGALDVRSPWLVENMTPEQAAYARELAIERKNQRERA